MATQREINNIEDLYNAVLEVNGISEPERIEFRVKNYSNKPADPSGYIPEMKSKVVNGEDGTPLYRRNYYDKNFIQLPGYDPNKRVVKNSLVAVPLHYTLDVNGVQIAVSIGVENRPVSNGKGTMKTVLRVPQNSRVIMDPGFTIIDPIREKAKKMALVLHPWCEFSPLNWSTELMEKTGIYVNRYDNYCPPGVKYTVVSFKDRVKTKKDTVDSIGIVECATAIASIWNRDPFVFRKFAERAGLTVGMDSGALERAFAELDGMKHSEGGRARIMKAAVDPSVSASALAEKAISTGMIQETENGWAWAVGSKMPLGIKPGKDSLVSKLDSDVPFRVMIQNVVDNRSNVIKTIDEKSEATREFILLVDRSLAMGYAHVNENTQMTPGAIYNADKFWYRHDGSKIVWGGNGKTADLWERTLKDYISEKVEKMIAEGKTKKDIKQTVMTMLGYSRADIEGV